MPERAWIRWRGVALIAISMALAWGLRGEFGHERGAAIVGAMASLSLAISTGNPQWILAAVVGSLTFAIGGALSYGDFIQPAFHGFREAIAVLMLVGMGWGGLGALGMLVGSSLARYRASEKAALAVLLWASWWAVDRWLWDRIPSLQEIPARALMAVVLFGLWTLLCAYLELRHHDRTAPAVSAAAAIGFGLGFPMAAWIQGAGLASGVGLDWWKIAEHLIGLVGGLGLGLAFRALTVNASPALLKRWGRWLAVTWLLWLLPACLINSNAHYWITERLLWPSSSYGLVIAGLFVVFAGFLGWGARELRRGLEPVAVSLQDLQKLWLGFVWLTTLIASSKSVLARTGSPAPVGYVVLAAVITWLTLSRRSSRATPGA